MRSRVFLAVAGLLAAAVVGTAAPARAAPGYPAASGRCVDQTGVLGDLCKKITTILLRDEKATSDEIAVAVVPTTGDESIEAWSTGLFDTWGVGKKDRNNGVLLVVAVGDHKVRLETGRGAADRLTHDEARRIIDDVVTPPFADENYSLGVLSGLDEVRRTLGHRVPGDARLASLAPAKADPATGGDVISTEIYDGDADGTDLPVGVIGMVGLFVVGLFAVFIYRVSRGGAPSGRSGRRWSPSTTTRSAHHTTWLSSTSGSGSGSGFGGGSSDGSGASGSW